MLQGSKILLKCPFKQRKFWWVCMYVGTDKMKNKKTFNFRPVTGRQLDVSLSCIVFLIRDKQYFILGLWQLGTVGDFYCLLIPNKQYLILGLWQGDCGRLHCLLIPDKQYTMYYFRPAKTWNNERLYFLLISKQAIFYFRPAARREREA